MEFKAKIQEKSKGGKKQPDYRQQFILVPQNDEFLKGEKVCAVVEKVEVESDENGGN